MTCVQQGACRRGSLLYVWCMCACMLCTYVHVCLYATVELVMLQLLPCACRACHCCTCTAFPASSVLLCCLLLTVYEQAARRKVTVLPGDVYALACAGWMEGCEGED
jgi:hypothetical protein